MAGLSRISDIDATRREGPVAARCSVTILPARIVVSGRCIRAISSIRLRYARSLWARRTTSETG